MSVLAPKKSHKRKTTVPNTVVMVPLPSEPTSTSNLFDLLGGSTVAVGGDVLETQRHAVLRPSVGAGGESVISILLNRTSARVGLSESLQQHIPTHLLANAVISFMAPPSMTEEEWCALAWAHPTLHATLDRLGSVTSLVSLSVFKANGDISVYYRGVAEAAVPVGGTARLPVPEPDVMLAELGACVGALAQHAHAAREKADLGMLLDCIAETAA